MTIVDFIPELWSPLLIQNLRERKDITMIFNRDYEGEITRMGDIVHIQKYTGATVADYNTTGLAIVYEPVNSSQIDLVINKKKVIAVELEDIDDAQANISLDAPIIQDFAEKLQIQRNTDVLTDAVAGVPTANIIDATSEVDLDDFRDQGVILDLANADEERRFCFIDPRGNGDLLGNSNIIQANTYGTSVPLIRGEVGMLLGFRLVKTTSLPVTAGTAGQTQLLFTHADATAFAAQRLFNVEALRDKDRASDFLRVLNLYGTKTINAEASGIVLRDDA